MRTPTDGWKLGARRTPPLWCGAGLLAVLWATGCLLFVPNAEAIDVHLVWEYVDMSAEGVAEFRLYEGVNDRCADAVPLTTMAQQIDPVAREVVRIGVVDDATTVCYELTAFNGLESTHSNRAVELLSTFAPAAPTGVTVQPAP